MSIKFLVSDTVDSIKLLVSHIFKCRRESLAVSFNNNNDLSKAIISISDKFSIPINNSLGAIFTSGYLYPEETNSEIAEILKNESVIVFNADVAIQYLASKNTSLETFVEFIEYIGFNASKTVKVIPINNHTILAWLIHVILNSSKINKNQEFSKYEEFKKLLSSKSNVEKLSKLSKIEITEREYKEISSSNNISLNNKTITELDLSPYAFDIINNSLVKTPLSDKNLKNERNLSYVFDIINDKPIKIPIEPLTNPDIIESDYEVYMNQRYNNQLSLMEVFSIIKLSAKLPFLCFSENQLTAEKRDNFYPSTANLTDMFNTMIFGEDFAENERLTFENSTKKIIKNNPFKDVKHHIRLYNEDDNYLGYNIIPSSNEIITMDNNTIIAKIWDSNDKRYISVTFKMIVQKDYNGITLGTKLLVKTKYNPKFIAPIISEILKDYFIIENNNELGGFVQTNIKSIIKLDTNNNTKSSAFDEKLFFASVRLIELFYNNITCSEVMKIYAERKNPIKYILNFNRRANIIVGNKKQDENPEIGLENDSDEDLENIEDNPIESIGKNDDNFNILLSQLNSTLKSNRFSFNIGTDLNNPLEIITVSNTIPDLAKSHVIISTLLGYFFNSDNITKVLNNLFGNFTNLTYPNSWKSTKESDILTIPTKKTKISSGIKTLNIKAVPTETKKIDIISRYAPEFYERDYVNKCQCEKQPLLLSDGELKNLTKDYWDPERILKVAGKTFVCASNEYKYPYMTKSTKERFKNDNPHICCFKTKGSKLREDSSAKFVEEMNTRLNIKSSTVNDDKIKKPDDNKITENKEEVVQRAYILSRLSTLDKNRFGVIPQNLKQTLRKIFNEPYGEFIRIGVGGNTEYESLIRAVNVAVKGLEEGFNDIEDIQDGFKGFGKSVIARGSGIYRQEFNGTEPNVDELLESIDYNIRILELYFNTNIFVFESNILLNDETTDFSPYSPHTPSYKKFHTRPYPLFDKSIVLFKTYSVTDYTTSLFDILLFKGKFINQGLLSEYDFYKEVKSYDETPMINRPIDGTPTLSFDSKEIKQSLYSLFVLSNQPVIINNEIKSIDFYYSSGINVEEEVITACGNNSKIGFIEVDRYGKMRGIKLTDENGKRYFVTCSPIYPLDYPVVPISDSFTVNLHPDFYTPNNGFNNGRKLNKGFFEFTIYDYTGDGTFKIDNKFNEFNTAFKKACLYAQLCLWGRTYYRVLTHFNKVEDLSFDNWWERYTTITRRPIPLPERYYDKLPPFKITKIGSDGLFNDIRYVWGVIRPNNIIFPDRKTRDNLACLLKNVEHYTTGFEQLIKLPDGIQYSSDFQYQFLTSDIRGVLNSTEDFVKNTSGDITKEHYFGNLKQLNQWYINKVTLDIDNGDYYTTKIVPKSSNTVSPLFMMDFGNHTSKGVIDSTTGELYFTSDLENSNLREYAKQLVSSSIKYIIIYRLDVFGNIFQDTILNIDESSGRLSISEALDKSDSNTLQVLELSNLVDRTNYNGKYVKLNIIKF